MRGILRLAVFDPPLERAWDAFSFFSLSRHPLRPGAVRLPGRSPQGRRDGAARPGRLRDRAPDRPAQLHRHGRRHAGVRPAAAPGSAERSSGERPDAARAARRLARRPVGPRLGGGDGRGPARRPGQRRSPRPSGLRGRSGRLAGDRRTGRRDARRGRRLGLCGVPGVLSEWLLRDPFSRGLRARWSFLRRLRQRPGRSLYERDLPLRRVPCVRRRARLCRGRVQVHPELVPERLLSGRRLSRALGAVLRDGWHRLQRVRFQRGHLLGRRLPLRGRPGMRGGARLCRRSLQVHRGLLPERLLRGQRLPHALAALLRPRGHRLYPLRRAHRRQLFGRGVPLSRGCGVFRRTGVRSDGL